MTAAKNGDAPWVDQVLGFWFGELSRSQWYERSAATDQSVRARFGDLYEGLSAEPPGISGASRRSVLAVVIVLDQFPRNMFRNSPEAFASDGAALALAEAATARGLDRELTAEQRHCLYLPFQHCEDGEVQAPAVALYAELGDAEGLDFARRHKDIIDRFPHRNAVLGRESTAEELAFLAEPGSSF
jgi:uncharacterized protein (DUF924 family)